MPKPHRQATGLAPRTTSGIVRTAPAAAGNPAILFPFETEHDTARRTTDEAGPHAVSLLARLGCSTEEPPAEIVRLAVALPMRITWYNSACKVREESIKKWNRVTVGCVIAVILLYVVLAITGIAFAVNGKPTDLGAAQVGVLVPALVAIARVLSQSSDQKSQLAAFWSARAQLKDKLYSFEDQWRDKVKDVTDSEFLARVRTLIHECDAIEADERGKFFAAIATPDTLFNTLTASAATTPAWVTGAPAVKAASLLQDATDQVKLNDMAVTAAKTLRDNLAGRVDKEPDLKSALATANTDVAKAEAKVATSREALKAISEGRLGKLPA